MTGKLFSNQRGFSLLEVLVALTVLSIGVLGVAAMSVSVSQGNSVARKVTAATVLAQGQMETFKNTPFANITTGSDSNNPIDENGNAGGVYTLSWTVTSNTPFANVNKVVCTVSWDSGARSVSLSTLIARAAN